MIQVQIFEKLAAEPEDRESWISAIPYWDSYEGFDLLSAVGWYVDAVYFVEASSGSGNSMLRRSRVSTRIDPIK